MQIVKTSELTAALSQYIDPEGGTYAEESAAFAAQLLPVLAAAGVEQVLFWDDQDGGDPKLDMDDWNREDAIPLTYNSAGHSYYGLTHFVQKYTLNGESLIWHLWFGGSPVNSAPGFYVIGVLPPVR